MTDTLSSSDQSTYRNQRAISSISTWLDSKGSTLWSTFDISDEKGRTRAAVWFWSQLREFMDYEEPSDAER